MGWRFTAQSVETPRNNHYTKHMDQITTPYPIEGSIETKSDTLINWSLPCEQEWLSEHESGDISWQIRNDVRANHGTGYRAEFIVYASGRYELTQVTGVEE